MCMQIIYSDNGIAHKDLFLEINAINLHVIADTYYFRIIDNFEPEADIDSRVKHALALLLQYWIKKIDALNVSDYCYLPFDFSDQYTGCLNVVKVHSSSFRVCYGYSLLVEGWNVNPLDPDDYSERVTDFQKTTDVFEIDSNVFKGIIKTIQELFIS